MDKSPGLDDYRFLYQEAEKRRKEAEKALREATGPTTFPEFIENCHNYISKPLQVEKNPAKCTGGSLTSPKGRLCPTHLRPWLDFQKRQTESYQKALRLLGSSTNPGVFSSRSAILDLGHRLCRRRYASEEDLLTWQRLGVEDHVSDIINAMRDSSNSPEIGLGGGIHFDNHTNNLDDDFTPEQDVPKRKRSIPDQFCVHLKDAYNTLLLIIEYKAGHKLTAEYLRAALRPMDIWKEVVQRTTIPVDRDEKLQYNAEVLTDSALSHIYDSMMCLGVPNALLTTGSCLVFLHVAEEEPETLQYFLTEPNLDVQTMSDQGNHDWMYTPITAVGRLLALCLMSLDEPIRSQHWRNKVIPQLPRWEVDFEHILAQIPDDEVHSPPPGSEYIPSSSPMSSFSESHNTGARVGCRPDSGGFSSPNDSESDDVSRKTTSDPRKRVLSEISSSPPQPRQHRSGQQYKRTNRPASTEGLDFCTQHCLLGLQSGGRLDEDCPNIGLHRVPSFNNHLDHRDHQSHPISCERLVCLLKQQLDADLDHYCSPCGQRGERSVPFKLSLMPYGYTLLGKGTTDQWSLELRREAEVYQILRPVQGSAVPVFLGLIDLKSVYFYGRARITHFTLLSWCGHELNLFDCKSEQWHAYQRTIKMIRHLGVHPGNLQLSDVLWNPVQSCVQLTGFRKARLLPKLQGKRKRRAPVEIPRKRVSVQ